MDKLKIKKLIEEGRQAARDPFPQQKWLDILRRIEAELDNKAEPPKYYDPDERNTFGFPTGR